MTRPISIPYFGTRHSFQVPSYPSECGLCHKNIDPLFISGAFIKGDSTSGLVEAVFQCTNLQCNGLIIGYYLRPEIGGEWRLTKIAPVNPTKKVFDDEILEVSPNFTEIYNQAFHAEQTGLALISGIGYRKALEFLIKDYLIFLDKENEEAILKLPLGQCINKLENRRIQEISKLATWIGNDEAHYTRKWEDKDVNDLKKLIEVTVHFIAMEVTADKYIQEMK